MLGVENKGGGSDVIQVSDQCTCAVPSLEVRNRLRVQLGRVRLSVLSWTFELGTLIR